MRVLVRLLRAPGINRWTTLGVAAAILLGVAIHDARTLIDGDPEPYRVFGSLWASGTAASHHQNPFLIYPMTWQFPPAGDGPLIADVNLNPPCLLPLFQLFALLAPQVGVVVWTAMSFLAFTLGAVLLAGSPGALQQRRQIVWLLLLFPAVSDTLWLGQDYAILFLLAVLAWRWKDTSPALAFACIGLLIAAKPILLPWPIFLLVSGHRRAAWQVALTALIASLTPSLIYGPHIYLEWHAATVNDPHWMFPTNVAAIAYFRRMGLDRLGVAVSSILALALFVVVLRTRPRPAAVGPVAICAAILCSPLAWFHYALLLTPWFVSRRWGVWEHIAAALLAVPVLVPVAAIGEDTWKIAVAGGFYFAAMWVLLFIALRRAPNALQQSVSAGGRPHQHRALT